jgi:hypothetical protein
MWSGMVKLKVCTNLEATGQDDISIVLVELAPRKKRIARGRMWQALLEKLHPDCRSWTILLFDALSSFITVFVPVSLITSCSHLKKIGKQQCESVAMPTLNQEAKIPLSAFITAWCASGCFPVSVAFHKGLGGRTLFY